MPLLRYLGWPTLAGILAAAVIILLFPATRKQDGGDQVPMTVANPVPASAKVDKQPASYALAVRNAAPAVVNIYTRKALPQKHSPLLDDPFFRRFFDNSAPPRQQRMESSLGSGVVMNTDGFILTNNHVVAGADEIIALLNDGREAEAKMVGSDPETDLAVLKIDLGNLHPIAVGRPERAQVGDIVLAIGNPFGVGQSVSQGIISATGRYGFGLSTYENFLQTDAAINPGNSGGALIDTEGQLLGINSATLDQSSSIGISFAISADIAVKVLAEIVAHGHVTRGWLGVDTQQISPEIAAKLGIQPPAALLITNVYVDSPAHQAGLQPGDVITSINGQVVGDGSREMRAIADLKPGDPISLSLIRHDRKLTIDTVAGARPPASLVN
ncbi:MAG: trypsin-like peptidase domain-containing protein [Porticoccaceae bacterium]